MNKERKTDIRKGIREKIDTTHKKEISENEEKFLFDLTVIWQLNPSNFARPILEEDRELFQEESITIENSHITKLNLEGRKLNTLPESIGELTQLTHLNLILNDLYSLPDSIGQLAKLTHLNLSANYLCSLPDSIRQLTQLTNLNLDEIQLTDLPDTIGELTQLIHLNLNSNQLTDLPDTIGELTQLTHLGLSFNQLTDLPDTIGELTQLTHLNLNNNQLTGLPDTIGQLTQLTHLNLSENNLSSLPDSIGQLTQLTHLNLNYNQLTDLPDTKGQLTQLTQIDLYNNQLTDLPDTIGQLTQLTHLNLAYNRLTNLPDTIGQLTQLTKLDLAHNRFTSLPVDMFAQMKEQIDLNIRQNQLTEISGITDKLAHLKQLDWRSQWHDDFTMNVAEDYFLILKDGRIVGCRPPDSFVKSLDINFDVMGIRCDTANDAGWSPPFSPQGLDYDLYLTWDEIVAIMRTVPDPDIEQFLIALPIFENEHLSTDNKSSSRDKIIAFRPIDKIDGEDKHLLFVYNTYLFDLFERVSIFEWKAKTQKLRNYKRIKCGLKDDIYNYPDGGDDDYYGGIGGFMNFFELINYKNPLYCSPLSGVWRSVLMCDNCGKFYRSKKDITLADCPVCLKTYSERAQQSIENLGHVAPCFQTVIPEFPLDADNIKIRDE